MAAGHHEPVGRAGRGVYLLSAGGMPQHLEIKVAWLRLQPKAFTWHRPLGHPDSGVVSHASACQLHELGDIPAPDVEITVPRRRTTTESFVHLRVAPVEATEITVVDGLPVTTARRTIVDLLRAKADGGHIGGVIAEAERRDLISLDDLTERVRSYTRRYGLKAHATGRDLIDHLVAQAGESLRRQEVDRASQEGFYAALRLLSVPPELAAHLSKRRQDLYRQMTEANSAVAAAARMLPKPDPATDAAAIRKRTRSNHAAMRAVQRTATLSPAIREALENSGLFLPVRASAPSGHRDRKDNDRPGDSPEEPTGPTSKDAEETS